MRQCRGKNICIIIWAAKNPGEYWIVPVSDNEIAFKVDMNFFEVWGVYESFDTSP